MRAGMALPLPRPALLVAVWAVIVQGGCAQSSLRGAAVESPPAASEGRALRAGLDARDVELARTAVQEALETQPSLRTRFWTNEETGNAGSVTPLRTFQTSTGFYCREYEEVVLSRRYGRAAVRYTACRDLDGEWKLVEG
jgi:surface antigen